MPSQAVKVAGSNKLKIFGRGEHKLRYSSMENISYNNNEVVRNGLGRDGCSIKRPPLFSLFSLVVKVVLESTS